MRNWEPCCHRYKSYSPILMFALTPNISEVRTVCVSSARTGLCGAQWVQPLSLPRTPWSAEGPWRDCSGNGNSFDKTRRFIRAMICPMAWGHTVWGHIVKIWRPCISVHSSLW